MLISHLKKFIYTKTTKTAGTSVESYFEKFCMPDGEWEFQHAREEYVSETGVIGYRGINSTGKVWFNHMSAANIKKLAGETVWNEYFKFAVIRNPFDRHVSRFFFVNKPTGSRDTMIKNFRDWVKDGGVNTDRNVFTIDGHVCLDFFIRYENLIDGVGQVCRRLEIPFEPERLPHLKASFRDRKISLSDFYDYDAYKIVRQKCEFELNYFRYSLPGFE